MGTTVQFGQCFKIIYYAYPCLYGSTEGEVGNFKYESEIRLPKGCEFLSLISHWQIEYINQLICVHTIRNLIENKKSEDLTDLSVFTFLLQQSVTIWQLQCNSWLEPIVNCARSHWHQASLKRGITGPLDIN